jgi:hypothetical protein
VAKGLEHGLCSSTNTAHSSSEGVDEKEKALELNWFEYWDTRVCLKCGERDAG